MVEFISFELCKNDGQSKYIKYFKRDNDFYLETASGFQGMYIILNNRPDLDSNERLYRLSESSARLVSDLMESLKIYSWPKSIPSGYTPSDRIIGSDEDTWSLDYKEEEKKTTRHIRGKGPFPTESPYKEFYRLFTRTIPDQETKDWFLKEYEDKL